MKMRSLVAATAIALLVTLLAGCPETPPTLSSAKELVSFSFMQANNDWLDTDYSATANPFTGTWQVGPLPAGTDLSTLVANFSVSPKASLKVGSVTVRSGITAANYSAGTVTLVVTAENGSTKNYTLEVSATDLGFSAFTLTGATMPELSLERNDAATPRTLSGTVLYKYRTEVDAFVVHFTHNGASVTDELGTAIVDGATVDFSTQKTFTVHGDGATTAVYQVNLTVNTVASTESRMDSFVFTFDGTDYSGVVSGTPVVGNTTAGTITVNLPSGCDVTNYAPTFAKDAGAEVRYGAVDGPLQTSGVDTHDFSSPVHYFVIAEDEVTVMDYTVTVTVNPTLAIITQACPSFSSIYAIGGDTWFDVKIPNKAALGAGWKIYTANNNWVRLQMIDTALFTNFQDGDTIRIIESSYTGTVNALGDPRPADGVWLYKSSQSTVLSSYGTVWIEDSAGNVLDMLAYTSQFNTSNYWIVTTTNGNPPDAPTRLSEAVADLQWVGTTLSGAASLPDATNYVLRLKDTSVDGNKASDWESYAIPMVKITASAVTPTWAEVTETVGCSVVFTATTSTYGGATITNIGLDLSDAELGGGANDLMNDAGEDGDVSAGDGIYTLTHLIPAGVVVESLKTVNATVTASVTVSGFSYELTVSPNPPPVPKLAFNNSDMENGGPAGIPADGSIYTADFYAGLASFRYSKTVSANATVAVTTDKFVPLAGYTKLSFWFKGTTSGTAPGLRFELGGGGSVLNYFDINGITSGVEWHPPLTTGGAYSTTPITVTEWTKVVVDLTGLQFTTGTWTDQVLRFRVRSSSVHAWMIDEVKLEP